MAGTASGAGIRFRLGSKLGVFAARPRLTSGFVLGLLAFLLMTLASTRLEASSRAIISWDVTCLWFLTLTLLHMRRQTQADLKAHVAAQDEGQGIIVTVVMVAAAASLWAVGLELSLAKEAKSLAKELRVALALLTVALSWFTTQLIFALHYAHEYYAPDKTTAEEDDVIGGLQFPGGQEPDNWDFLHFAVVIGVASQTADIAFTAKRLRRIGTVHGIIAFSFNTAVLALTINLIAGLF
jgi:uncharacterized membrane protein